MAHRMRIERRDDAGAPFGACPVQRRADHGLVAKVEAVEIPQRQNRAAQMIGQGFTVIEANHGWDGL